MIESNPHKDWREVFAVFLRLGLTSFGGPAAHLAMMEEELVRRRQWLTHAEFMDLIGAANLIPGPNSTEVAIHTGYRTGGRAGLIAAGIAFILPAFLIVWLCAWVYVKYGSLPALESVFNGLAPAILAIIAIAIYKLSRSAIKDFWLGLIAALATATAVLGFNQILILIFAAACYLGVRKTSLNALSPAAFLFLYFAKVGSVLFGSGYVLIAFLQADLVDRYALLNQKQLLDAIAIGQFTPGPVFTTATFIGYLIHGNWGAVVATAGIFLPAFIFVALTAPFISRLRGSETASRILDGLNSASLGLMASAALLLARSTMHSYASAAVFLISLALLARTKINSIWILLAAGLSGFIF